MSFATTNQTGLYIVEEATWGVTPATPVLQELRLTGEGINYEIENVTSDELRSDRMVSDTVQVGQTTSGNVDFELSYGTYDSLMESAVYSEFVPLDSGNTSDTITAGASGSNLEITVSDTGTITFGSAYTIDAAVGQWVYLNNATTPANNNYYRITAVAGNEITVVPTPDTSEVLESVSTVSSARLRNAATAANILEKSFTVQKVFNDTTVPTYQNFTGMIADTMSLNFEVGSILTGSFGFMGRAADISTSPIAGSTTTNATTTDVMNSVSNLNNIEFDDTDTSASLLSMTLETTGNLRAQKAIGSLASVGVGTGRLEITGSISLYFENITEYNKFLQNTAFKVSFRVNDSAGNAYIVTLPKVKYEGMTMVAGGLDADIEMSGNYRALLGTSDGVNYMIEIDRVSA
jgi:hypothetical protein